MKRSRKIQLLVVLVTAIAAVCWFALRTPGAMDFAIGGDADVTVAQKPPPATAATARTQGPHGPAGDDGGLGLRVFQGACASCHHWDGSGVQSPYAALTEQE